MIQTPCYPATCEPVTMSMDPDLNVAECLARVRDHDQEAARSLVEYLYPTVIKIVRSNLPRRMAEEDLAQEVMAKVFERLEQYEGKVPVTHWVSRIAVNHCLNALRSQKARPEWRMADLSEEQVGALEASIACSTAQPEPADLLGARELVDLLLATLSPQDRLIIRMLELEERSVSEVQSLTGWSPTYIRVRAFRARSRLNKTFRRLREKGRL